MPIYEYTCMDCENEFEYLVFGSNDTVICPECKQSKVKRRISACCFKTGGQQGGGAPPPSSSSSGCSSCSGGNCHSCH